MSAWRQAVGLLLQKPAASSCLPYVHANGCHRSRSDACELPGHDSSYTSQGGIAVQSDPATHMRRSRRGTQDRVFVFVHLIL